MIYGDHLISTAEIAEIVGLNPKTINNWCEERGNPNLRHLRLLYEETGLSEFIEYFFNFPDSEHMIIEKPSGDIDTRDLLLQQIDIGEAYGDFMSEIKCAVSDGKITSSEKRSLMDNLKIIQREAAELIEHLKE